MTDPASCTHVVRVEASIVIQAQPDRVFGVIDDEDLFFELRPNALEHIVVRRHPSGGHDCIHRYRRPEGALDRRDPYEIHWTNLEFDPGRRMVDTGRLGDVNHLSVTTFDAHDIGTRVSITYELTSTQPVNRLVRWTTRRLAIKELTAFLGRVKALSEHGEHD